MGNIVKINLLIPGRNSVQCIRFSDKEITIRGLIPMASGFHFFCCFGPRFDLIILAASGRHSCEWTKKNAVHTRRSCHEKKNKNSKWEWRTGKKKKGLVEYRLTFQCFGGDIWTLAYQDFFYFYYFGWFLVETWGQSSQFSNKENTRRGHSRDNWNFFCCFGPRFDLSILATSGRQSCECTITRCTRGVLANKKK